MSESVVSKKYNYKKKSVIIYIIVFLVLTLIASSAIILIGNINKNLEMLNEQEFYNINMSLIPDGTYFGSYNAFPISVEVNVTVKDHEITEIEILKHSNGQGAAAETIIDDVLEAQSLDVDAVTGATYSSKVILLAIENALLSAIYD